MKLPSKLSTLAIATAMTAVLSTSASFAMGSELTQLQTAIRSELVAMNIDAKNLDSLTLNQVALIKSLIESSDGSRTEQINFILGNSGPHMAHMTSLTMMGGRSQLEAAAVNDLKEIGVAVNNPGNLTVAQLTELKLLFDGPEPPTKEKAEAILAQ